MKRLSNNSDVCLTVEMNYDCKLDNIAEKWSPSLKLANIMSETQTEISEVSDREFVSSASRNCRRLLIKGSLTNAEQARQRIRAIFPVEFVLSCRVKNVDLLGQQLLTAHFSTVFGVMISFLLIADDDSYQVSFRGNRKSTKWLKEAALHFCDITQIPLESSVEAQFNVSKDHAVLIRNHIHLMERCTGVMLRCPTDNSLVFTRGSVDSIFLVGEFIEGLAPIRLHFTVEWFDIDRITAIARGMDVLLSVREEENSIQAFLCTYEWNSRFLYELWRLASQDSSKVIPVHPDSWMSLSAGKLFFGNLIELAHWTCCDERLDEEMHSVCITYPTVIRSVEKSPPPLTRLPCTSPNYKGYQSTYDSEPPELQIVNNEASSPSLASAPPPTFHYDLPVLTKIPPCSPSGNWNLVTPPVGVSKLKPYNVSKFLQSAKLLRYSDIPH